MITIIIMLIITIITLLMIRCQGCRPPLPPLQALPPSDRSQADLLRGCFQLHLPGRLCPHQQHHHSSYGVGLNEEVLFWLYTHGRSVVDTADEVTDISLSTSCQPPHSPKVLDTWSSILEAWYLKLDTWNLKLDTWTLILNHLPLLPQGLAIDLVQACLEVESAYRGVRFPGGESQAADEGADSQVSWVLRTGCTLCAYLWKDWDTQVSCGLRIDYVNWDTQVGVQLSGGRCSWAQNSQNMGVVEKIKILPTLKYVHRINVQLKRIQRRTAAPRCRGVNRNSSELWTVFSWLWEKKEQRLGILWTFCAGIQDFVLLWSVQQTFKLK